MATSYLISKPNNEALVLTKSRRHSILIAGSQLVFCISWYAILLVFHKGLVNLIDKVRGLDWFTILFVTVPLLGLPELIQSIKNVIWPRKIVFDADLRRIIDDNRIAASFEDVTFVQIKTVKDSEWDKFRLSINLKTNSKIIIDWSANYEEIYEIADAIADTLKVKVETTN